MDLQQTLSAIADTASIFKNGSQITVAEGAYEPVHVYLDLITLAKALGATPYEIERAAAGEFIGSSFLPECTSDEK